MCKNIFKLYDTSMEPIDYLFISRPYFYKIKEENMYIDIIVS